MHRIAAVLSLPFFCPPSLLSARDRADTRCACFYAYFIFICNPPLLPVPVPVLPVPSPPGRLRGPFGVRCCCCNTITTTATTTTTTATGTSFGWRRARLTRRLGRRTRSSCRRSGSAGPRNGSRAGEGWPDGRAGGTAEDGGRRISATAFLSRSRDVFCFCFFGRATTATIPHSSLCPVFFGEACGQLACSWLTFATAGSTRGMPHSDFCARVVGAVLLLSRALGSGACVYDTQEVSRPDTPLWPTTPTRATTRPSHLL